MTEKKPKIIDFPKIQSPFIRKHINGHYVVTRKINPDCEWVFTQPGVKAVDKLHGTNICISIDNGMIVAADNRRNRIIDTPYVKLNTSKHQARIFMGVFNAINKGWLNPNLTDRVYGELIGPDINQNLHDVPTYYFVPYFYLQKSCHWKSWVNNTYPKTYDAISEWFKNLESLFSQKMKRQTQAEGLVFTSPDGKMAKLRRDMFEWYYE